MKNIQINGKQVRIGLLTVPKIKKIFKVRTAPPTMPKSNAKKLIKVRTHKM
jgi:hypothetical protein